MKDLTSYIKQFQEIGLSEREAKVYMTLLTRRMFTAAELQGSVSIPRTKIYEVLQKMVRRGICIERRLGMNKIFMAVDPEIAFGKILEDYHDELRRKENLTQELSKILLPVFQQGRLRDNSQDFIEILKDKNQIHQKYISLMKNVTHELLTFNKGPYACDTLDKVDEQQSFEIKLVKKGGSSRGLYETGELETVPWLRESLLKEAAMGHEARLTELLPVKMIVFDDAAVMFALDEPRRIEGDELTMIAIEHSSIASACRILFNTVWGTAKPLILEAAVQNEGL